MEFAHRLPTESDRPDIRGPVTNSVGCPTAEFAVMFAASAISRRAVTRALVVGSSRPNRRC